MAAEHRELIWAVIDAFKRRDAEAISELFHPEGEWRPALSPGGIEGEVYVGPDRLREWFAEIDESWERYELDNWTVEEVGDKVLAFGPARLRGRASGVELEVELAQVWTFRDGLAWCGRGFASLDEARRAAAE